MALISQAFPTGSNFYIGGSRGGVRDARPPPGRPNSFDFMQFSGKFGVFTPPLEGSRPPPSGKSWIRHCFMLEICEYREGILKKRQNLLECKLSEARLAIFIT